MTGVRRVPSRPATWTLDVAAHQLTYGTHAIAVTPDECRMIEIMNLHAGPTPHATLIGNSEGAECRGLETIKIAIHRLRAKIRAAQWPDPIETMWGAGYRLRFPIVVQGASDPPVVIPGALRRSLMRLLHSHPDQREADRVLAVIG